MNYDIDDKYVNKEVAFAQLMCWPFIAVWVIGMFINWS